MQHSCYTTNTMLPIAAEFRKRCWNDFIISLCSPRTRLLLLGIIIIHEYDRSTSSNFCDLKTKFCSTSCKERDDDTQETT